MLSTKGLTPAEKKEFRLLNEHPYELSQEARGRLRELRAKIMASQKSEAYKKRVNAADSVTLGKDGKVYLFKHGKPVPKVTTGRTGPVKGLTGKEKKELRALVNSNPDSGRVAELKAKVQEFAATTRTLKARQPLPKVSSKQASRNREYTKLRLAYLTENPLCEICGSLATDIHHKKGRGIFTCDVSTFMATCRSCHDFRIHGDPKTAREKGYLL